MNTSHVTAALPGLHAVAGWESAGAQACLSTRQREMHGSRSRRERELTNALGNGV